MRTYYFLMGGTGLETKPSVKCVTDGNGTILSCNTSETSGNKRSIDAQFGSSGSDETSECTVHVIEDIENMYNEIIETIFRNELQAWVIPEDLDQQEILTAVLEDIKYELFYESSTDQSDNLSGYSDIISLSSDTVVSVEDLCDTYKDMMQSIKNTLGYLNTY